MATQQETVEFIIEKLGDPKTFSTRAMFGEYALYCKGKVVALICDDTFFVKILPASAALADDCEQGEAYPGSKPYYIVTEDMLRDVERIREILTDIAASLPAKKPKKNKSPKKSVNAQKKK